MRSDSLLSTARALQRRAREDLPPLAILIVAALILFWRVPLRGEVILPADIVLADPAWQSSPAAPRPVPRNPALSDQVTQFYPWQHLAAETLRSTGKTPLWNPYEMTGQPLVANSQSALFYPPNRLLRWLDPAWVTTIRCLLNLVLAGLFSYWLGREWNLSRWGACLAALSFMLCGPLIVWLGHPHANVLVCLPLLLLGCEKLLQGRSRTGWILALSLGTGLALVGGHIETAFHILVFSGLYFVLRLLRLKPGWPLASRRILQFLAATGLGILIGGIQLLPFAEFLRQSSMAATGRSPGGELIPRTREWLYNLATAVTLIYPGFFGSPADGNFWWPFKSHQSYNEMSLYLGFWPFLLALRGSLSRVKSPPVAILAILGVLALGVAWRFPGLGAVGQLPVFSLVINKRLKVMFTFAAAMLAGFGFDEMEREMARNRRLSRLSAGIALWGTGVALGSLLVLHAVRAVAAAPFLKAAVGLQYWATTLRAHAISIFPLTDARTALPLAGFAVLVCLYAATRRGSLPGSALGKGVLALSALELLACGAGYNPTVRRADVFPEPAPLEALAHETSPYRIMSEEDVFPPNYGAVFGVAQLEGYDLPVYKTYSALYRAQGGEGRDYRPVWSEKWPLVDWLNVKYVLTRHELPGPRFVPVVAAGAVKLYRNEEALSRAFLVRQVEVAGDDARALARVTSGAFDFRNVVLLRTPLPPNLMRRLAASEGDSARGDVSSRGDISWIRYQPDVVSLKVATPAPAILVMSDLYAAGWKATLDGSPTPLYRANFAYRAVFVPDGAHTVEFRYAPASFRAGALLSRLGLILTAAWCALRLRPRRRDVPARAS